MNNLNTTSPRTTPLVSLPAKAARRLEFFAIATAIALLLAAAAQIGYPIPGSPVPATLQTLVVLCAGTLAGSALGLAGVGLYLVIGFAGFAVFAEGPVDWRALPGPTAGYLVGFLLVQPILGRLVTSKQRNAGRVLGGLVFAQALIFGLGLLWLQYALQTTWDQALAMGLWPFVPVDLLLKTVAAFGLTWLGGRKIRCWIDRE